MLTPKVGDTVMIEGIVTSVNVNGFQMATKSNNGSFTDFMPCIAFGRIKEIISPPIKVGDTVRKKDDIVFAFDYTVLAVHGSGTSLAMPYGPTRHWAVCVHGDDIPVVFNMDNIVCVD